MPEEILAKIFYFASRNGTTLRTLSDVCTRFKYICDQRYVRNMMCICHNRYPGQLNSCPSINNHYCVCDKSPHHALKCRSTIHSCICESGPHHALSCKANDHPCICESGPHHALCCKSNNHI